MMIGSKNAYTPILLALTGESFTHLSMVIWIAQRDGVRLLSTSYFE